MIKRSTKIIFTKKKKLFKIDEIDFDNTLVSKKKTESYCTKNSLKYFIGYNDDDDIRPGTDLEGVT